MFSGQKLPRFRCEPVCFTLTFSQIQLLSKDSREIAEIMPTIWQLVMENYKKQHSMFLLSPTSLVCTPGVCFSFSIRGKQLWGSQERGGEVLCMGAPNCGYPC